MLPLDSTAVVFAGDSHVEYGHWTEWLGTPVLNRGIAGDDVAGLQARLGPILDAVPQHVLLLIGFNDVLYGRTTEAILTTYANLITSLQTQQPNLKLTLVNLPPLPDEKEEDRQRNRTIEAVNAGLADLAAQHNLTCIDLFSAVALEDALNPALTYDGIHFNGAGYQRFATLLRPHLAK